MTSVIERYRALVKAGELRPDPEQAIAAERLHRLAGELEAVPKKGSILWRALGRLPEPPRGLYIWGSVGRGKSMLMDLFYESVNIRRKRRVHFHEFMLEVHERLNEERKKDTRDPVVKVADAMAEDVRLLAFDEMVVNNPADAMILSRLFTEMMGHGLTMVATSNRPPRDLYKDGLNRTLFIPFIELIETRMDVVALNGPTDYRLDRLGRMDTWLVPNGPEATKQLSAAFFRLTDYPVEDAAHVPSCALPVQGGRELHVPKCLKGVAVFSFKRLCGEARGAADYLAIARRFHTVILVGIPRLGPENRNEAARFVTLIDALYEHKVKLLAAADAEPQHLYEAGDGRFEFDRTVSRLMEMRSDAYLAEGHGERQAADSGQRRRQMTRDQRDFVTKVPAVTLGFWIIKILATTLGETGGDTVSMTWEMGYLASTAIFVVPLVLLVAWQIAARRFHPFLYWATIIASTTAGTTMADFATRSLGIGYTGGSALLLACVLGALGLWHAALGSVSVDTVRSPPAEGFYWLTITFSQTLGTALGDWAADDGGLGYAGGAMLFGGALAGLALLYYRTRTSRVALFWAAFILTRPLGATVGDFLDKPIAKGGLDFSRPLASAVLAAAILVLILVIPQRPGTHPGGASQGE